LCKHAASEHRCEVEEKRREKVGLKKAHEHLGLDHLIINSNEKVSKLSVPKCSWALTVTKPLSDIDYTCHLSDNLMSWFELGGVHVDRGGERGTARPEVLQSLLKTTDRVVQEIDSVEYGLTDIQVGPPCSSKDVSTLFQVICSYCLRNNEISIVLGV
jgi:hypothetical protein